MKEELLQRACDYFKDLQARARKEVSINFTGTLVPHSRYPSIRFQTSKNGVYKDLVTFIQGDPNAPLSLNLKKTQGIIEVKFNEPEKAAEVEKFLTNYSPDIHSGNSQIQAVTSRAKEVSPVGKPSIHQETILGFDETKVSLRALFTKCGAKAGTEKSGAHFHTFRMSDKPEDGMFVAEIFHYSEDCAAKTIDLLSKIGLAPELGKMKVTAIKVKVPVGKDYAKLYDESFVGLYTHISKEKKSVESNQFVEACGVVFNTLSPENQAIFIRKFCPPPIIDLEKIKTEERIRLKELMKKALDGYIIIQPGAVISKNGHGAYIEHTTLEKLLG